jgi:hypothetical protein
LTTVKEGDRVRAPAALLLGIAMLAAGCVDPCGNEVVSDVPSPSGRHHAVVFKRDCGATTGLSVQASVLPSGGTIGNQAGNALTADAGHLDLPLKVTAMWETDNTLRLAYDARLRTFRKEPSIGGVTVVYAPAR